MRDCEGDEAIAPLDVLRADDAQLMQCVAAAASVAHTDRWVSGEWPAQRGKTMK